MIISRKDKQGYRNELTDYLDKYLVEEPSKYFSNYIYSVPVNNSIWLIRVPGATRGSFNVEDGIIKSIRLYEDSFCYRHEVLDNLNNFVGRKIDLPLDNLKNK